MIDFTSCEINKFRYYGGRNGGKICIIYNNEEYYVNNDIDIIGTFIGNAVTRIIQIFEFLIIYMYFLRVNFYIFLITLIVSIFMIIIILYFGSKIEIENKNRKDNLDYKTINIHNIYDILKDFYI